MSCIIYFVLVHPCFLRQQMFLAVLMGPLNIGYLFLRPYEEAAFAAFYRDVRDEKRQIEEIEMQDKWSENEPEKSENA